MAYQFSGLTSAKSYLESLGFTVGSPYLNSLTPLRNTSRRAELFYGSANVGYIETPTDLLPDENWVVNIPFENRSSVPEGVLNSIYGDTGANEGWTNRQFYIETNHFTRFKFGDALQHVVDAQGPGSSISLRTNSAALSLYKEPSGGTYNAVLDINMSTLAQQLRYEFSDIIEGVATPRPAPRDFDVDGAGEGYLISIDDTGHCRWMSQTELGLGGVVAEAVNAQQLGGIAAANYVTTSNLLDTVGGMIVDNIEQGIQVTYDSGKLNFNVNDFQITLEGAISGSVTITNLTDAILHTTLESTAHNHDDRYPLLVGNSEITGSLGATLLAAETGVANGVRLRTDLSLESTTRGVLQLHWDSVNACNEMWMGVISASDRVKLYGGARLTLDAVDLYETVTNINEAYTGKTEAGTTRVANIGTDTLNATTANINGTNVTLNATTLLSLLGGALTLVASGNINIDANTLDVDTVGMAAITSVGMDLDSGTGIMELTGNRLNAEFSGDVDIASNSGDLTLGANNTILGGTSSVSFNTPLLILPADVEVTEGTLFDIEYATIGLHGTLGLSGDTLTGVYTGAVSLSGASLSLISTVSTAYLTGETTAQVRGKTLARLVSDVAAFVGAANVTLSGSTLALLNSSTLVRIESAGNINIAATAALNMSGDDATLQITDDLVFNAHDLYANITDICQLAAVTMNISGSTALNLTSPAVGVYGDAIFYNDVEIQGNLTIVGGTFEVTPEMDARYINVDGDTMTGALSLNYIPSSALHAVNKQFLDDNYYTKTQSDASYYQKDDVYTKTESDNEFLSKSSGGTMVGALILAGAPSVDLEAATKKYVDDKIPLHKKAFTIGDGVATYFDLAHNLGTLNVWVEVYESTGEMWTVDASWRRVDTNTIRIYFDPADTPTTDQYIVSIFG